MIVRVERAGNPFAQIDKRPLSDARLTYMARGILAYLLTKPESWEVSVQEIVSNSPHGLQAIQSAFKELRSYGYADLVTAKVAGGKVSGKKWVIYENPTEHRQSTSPVVGDVTDKALNRSSVKPIIGQTDYRASASISNNGVLSNNRVLSNNENEREQPPPHEKKDFSKKIESGRGAGSQPHLSLFSEWEQLQRGAARENFCRELRELVPGVDAAHYYNRCQTWSATKLGRSADWIRTAADWAAKDQKEQSQKSETNATYSTGRNSGPTTKPSSRADERESIARIAAGVIARRASGNPWSNTQGS